jgi:hypothetical protein
MIVRALVGIGLFTLGYFVGKEMGRAESIRDQLSWATEDGDPDREERHAQAEIERATSTHD